jgi:proline iminopeptidase
MEAATSLLAKGYGALIEWLGFGIAALGIIKQSKVVEDVGIEKPIVYGASFGSMVALAYATRHPEHPGKLILVSTEAAGTSYPERRVTLFERLGGPEVGALARRRFLEGKLDAEDLEAWGRLAFPVSTVECHELP